MEGKTNHIAEFQFFQLISDIKKSNIVTFTSFERILESIGFKSRVSGYSKLKRTTEGGEVNHNMLLNCTPNCAQLNYNSTIIHKDVHAQDLY